MENQEETLDENTAIQNDDEPLVPVIRGSNQFKCPITVEPIVFGVFLADALAEPVTTTFLLKRTCEFHFHYNKSICSEMGGGDKNGSEVEALVQPYVSVILTGMNFLSVFFPAIMSLFVGPWTDYNGRKLMLVVPSLGYCLKYVLLGLFSWFPNVDPTLGLVAVLPVAFTGGIVNLISAAYAYISDVSLEENRSFRISVFESALYCSTIIGMLSTSYIFAAGGTYGFVLIYSICAVVVFIVSILTWIFVPESVQTLGAGKGVLHLFELKLFKEMLSVCFKKREGYRRAIIFLVIISLTVTIATSSGESNVLFLYTRLRFGWDIQEFTLWGSVSISTAFLGLLLGTAVLAKGLKTPDSILGLISFTLKAASSFYVAFIPPNAPRLMFYSGLIAIFGGLCGPAGRSVLSKSVPKEDIGKVFALTGSAEALFPLAFGPLYTFLYDSTLHVFPGSFFLFSGSLFVLCSVFFIAIHFMQNPRRYERVEEESGDRD